MIEKPDFCRYLEQYVGKTPYNPANPLPSPYMTMPEAIAVANYITALEAEIKKLKQSLI